MTFRELDKTDGEIGYTFIENPGLEVNLYVAASDGALCVDIETEASKPRVRVRLNGRRLEL